MNYEEIEVETKTLFRTNLIYRRDKEFVLDLAKVSEDHPEYTIAFYRNPKLFFKIINQIKNEDLNANNYILRVEGINTLEKISAIRTQHIGNLIKIRGIISNMTKSLALTVSKIFECPRCGTVIKQNVEEGGKEAPNKCSCGHKGQLSHIEDKVIDMQEMELEEIHDEINNRQPEKIRIRLLNELTSAEFKGKIQPGNKIEVVGMIEKVKTKRVQTEDEIYEYRVLAIDLVNLDEDYNDKMTEEDEKMIQEIAAANPLDSLAKSLAPEIYGHEDVKKSIILSMFGGVKKTLKDGKESKHNIHLFLVGDAGCVVGDSYIILADGTFRKIKDFGFKHKQDLNINVMTKDGISKADTFWKYENNSVKKITLEDGRELICNYKHPLLIKDKGWVQCGDLKVGQEAKVINKINCTKKDYVCFDKDISCNNNCKDINIPEIDEDVAFLLGLYDGDGNCRKYKVSLSFGENKAHMTRKVENILKSRFGIIPRINIREPKQSKIGNRLINRKERLTSIEVDSVKFSKLIKFKKSIEKRVPKEIMESKDSVVASYLDGLFSTDGCCFIDKRKDRCDKIIISLKSSSSYLLKDIQLLLLRFGINARINYNEIQIKKQEEVILFNKYIGFTNKYKSEILRKVKSLDKSHKPKEFMKIKNIEDYIDSDVYDITVEEGHNYISNGIVSHNTSKTVLLRNVQKRMPKSYYVSGEGMTAAGITASVEKDELLGTWGLKAGALVKANGSVAIVDELDKANSYAKQALHTPLESGEVPISKAGINTSLKANCAVIAAANPKDGRFDPNKPLVSQINMVPTLLSRFDIIHVMRDIVDEAKDSKIVDTLFSLEGKDSLISVDLFRKYVLYARKLKPKLKPELNEEIKKFYNKVRKQSINSGSNMEGMPITPRHLLGLLRMAEAHAKIRLSETVELEDLEVAKNLYYEALIKLGLDDSGSLDLARLSYGKTASKKRGMELVIEILRKAHKEEKKVKKDTLKEMLKNDINPFDFEDILSNLSKDGFIVFTREGIELIV